MIELYLQVIESYGLWK